jgi:uncharacterized protein
VGESNAGTVEAGDFSSWLTGLQEVLADGGDSDVPCGSCTACCRSSQFILVTPDDVDAIAHIPGELLFPAPLRPEGYFVMGYTKRGHCPMLKHDRCTIYEHRPNTCRVYDCRVFTASGVAVGGEKPLVAERVDRWAFTFDSDDAVAQHAAVQHAAVFIRSHRNELPKDKLPTNSTRHAVMAAELHDLFLTGEPDVGAVADRLAAT